MNNICEIITEASLIDYNTYKLNAKTKYLALPKTEEELINLLKYIKDNNLKYFLLGNGSNVILPENTFNGVVICLKNINSYEIDGTKVIASCGTMLNNLANETIKKGLKGLEWACGIPGTIGASILGNAGAYLHEIMEYVTYIRVLDKDFNIKKLKRNDITYEYRNTSLKETREYIILSCELELSNQDNIEESYALVKDRLERRLSSQPLEYPSAGSVFKNPNDLSAGKLIEDANLKGTNKNGAEISTKHGNFIINKGNANASDIIYLINLIKKTIKEKDNIDLKCEQEIVKWD